MYQLYTRTEWIGGICLLLAFYLTFRSSRPRLLTAAVMWTTGTAAASIFPAYLTFFGAGMAYAFGRGSFPLFGWLIPLTLLVSVVTQAILLFPWVRQATALRVGRILLLVVSPLFVLLHELPDLRQGWGEFPLGARWLAPVVLWFRLRELLVDRVVPAGAEAGESLGDAESQREPME